MISRNLQSANVSLVTHVLLNAIPNAAVLVDEWGIVRAINDRMGGMIGRGVDRLMGRPWSQAIVAESNSVGGQMEHTDEIGNQIKSLRCEGGLIRFVLESRIPSSVDSPWPGLSLVTVVDVSKLKKSEMRWRELCSQVSRLSDTVIEQALSLRHRLDAMEDRDQSCAAALRNAYFDATYMLAMASETRDERTGEHLRRIAAYSRAVASEIGLGQYAADEMATASILHDVGKFHLPDSLLNKPGQLTDSERALIREHTVAGERILPDKTEFLLARQIARSHHENWDGSGYPDGLSGSDIPLAARIVRVVDVFDALISARPYKAAWSYEDAMTYINSHAGTLFQPRIVNALTKLVHHNQLDPNSCVCPLSSEVAEPSYVWHAGKIG